MEKPLQWFICLLHANELPFRHLFIHLDGATSGPSAYTGKIVKHLKKSTVFPICIFKIIPTELPNISNIPDLSTDQKYLYTICTAISSGNVPDGLEDMAPGNISHARWLTTASHILRLYIGTPKPSKNLCTTVKYILGKYFR